MRPLTLAEARQQIALLEQQLHDKDVELSLYLQVAASFQVRDEAPDSSKAALVREVSQLRERVRLLSAARENVSGGSSSMAGGAGSTALMHPVAPWPMVHMMPPVQRRQTPLQVALTEINYAFDILDTRGDGVIGRWELLKGLMDVPEVRGLLRLGSTAYQSELDELISQMSGESATVGRHEFELFFTRREIERSGGGGSDASAGAAAAADKGAAAAKGGKGGVAAAAQGKGGKDAAKDAGGKDGGGKKAAAPGGGSAASTATARPAPPSQYTLPTGYTVPGYNAPGPIPRYSAYPQGGYPQGAYMGQPPPPPGPYAHPAYHTYPNGVPVMGGGGMLNQGQPPPPYMMKGY